MNTLSRILLFVLTSASLSSAQDAAGPEAWPMFRGTPTGSGRSSVVLQLPLEEQWHRRFEGGAFTATPVINANTIYLGDLDGHFMALSLHDGKTLWRFDSTNSGFPSAAAVSTKPKYPFVVVGDDLGVIRCMNSNSGKVVWTLSMEGEISGGPTILNVSEIPTVLIGSQDATLICLRVTDGEILWKHEIADQIRCSPTVDDSKDSKRVFLAGCDSTLHILNVVNGETVAEIPLGGPTGTTPSIMGSDVFFGTEGGRFFAVNFLEEKIQWQTGADSQKPAYRSSATTIGDLVFVGSRGRAVEAFNRADGSLCWRHPMRSRVDASPVAVRVRDEKSSTDEPTESIIVADTAGEIKMLQNHDGSECWEFSAGGGFSGSPAVVRDRVVLASDDGVIWCFGHNELKKQ
ncbi:MAG: PQQ-binding-like beta-propeller repeat protein [Planctomycetaceae bacterium]|nr:PQQ-binding-like beta-propeller repeat protein [Planctomycetaceae bacterium]